MEVSDAYGMDCGSDQLFLAAAMRCELGAWSILSRAASGSGDGLSGDLFGGGAAAGLLADAFGFAVVCARPFAPLETTRGSRITASNYGLILRLVLRSEGSLCGF
jgi:hypothetical protein